MLAICIEGLKLVRKAIKDLKSYRKIQWLTDSKYVADNVYQIQKWRRDGWIRDGGEPVLNADLWKDLEAVRSSLRVYPTWVSRDENGTADSLAKQAAKSPSHTDFGFNPGRVGSSVGTSRQAPTFFTKARYFSVFKISPRGWYSEILYSFQTGFVSKSL